jgi:hypothetical protein
MRILAPTVTQTSASRCYFCDFAAVYTAFRCKLLLTIKARSDGVKK